MSAVLLKLAFNWRTWVVAALAAVLVNQVVLSRQRDAAQKLAEARAETIARDAQAKADLERRVAAEATARVQAENALHAYADASLSAFQEQAEEAAVTSARLAEINRRVRAAQQEIARADGSLRLDDPMPDGLRHALACADGDSAACPTGAAAAPAGGVPGGAAGPAGAPGPAA